MLLSQAVARGPGELHSAPRPIFNCFIRAERSPALGPQAQSPSAFGCVLVSVAVGTGASVGSISCVTLPSSQGLRSHLLLTLHELPSVPVLPILLAQPPDPSRLLLPVTTASSPQPSWPDPRCLQ